MAPPGGQATPTAAVALHRIGRLSTAIVALTCTVAVLSAVSIWASRAARDDARALLDGTISTEDFIEGAATVATAVVSMVWMFRIARNHRTLHRDGTWGPGWAIGGWFLPPLLFVIPTLMFRELWKASDPDVAIGDDWRRAPTSALVPLWFVLYSLVPIGLLFGQNAGGLSLGASETDMAQQLLDDQRLTILSAVVSVAGAVVYILLVRGLTNRHRQLTGESTG